MIQHQIIDIYNILPMTPTYFSPVSASIIMTIYTTSYIIVITSLISLSSSIA